MLIKYLEIWFMKTVSNYDNINYQIKDLKGTIKATEK